MKDDSHKIQEMKEKKLLKLKKMKEKQSSVIKHFNA